MTCCFIGHKKIEETPALREKIRETVEELVAEGTTVFLFGDHSEFNDLCHEAVSKCRETRGDLKRIHYRVSYPGDIEETKQYFLHGFEDSIFPSGAERAGRAIYVERNRAMILASDVCVFYYNEAYLPDKRKASKRAVLPYQRKSGTRLSYEFAVQKKKRILNLYETSSAEEIEKDG